MTKSIDFYFDFISPYSYLAIHKLKTLKNYEEININYKPILLGGLHNLGGITAPAFNERKLKNMKFDCNLIAKKNNIPFIWNTKFPINSLYLMRGYLAINEELKVCFDKNSNVCVLGKLVEISEEKISLKKDYNDNIIEIPINKITKIIILANS